MCYLHLHSLGLAKVYLVPLLMAGKVVFMTVGGWSVVLVQTHLLYTVIKLGKEKWLVLEKRLVNHLPFIGSKQLECIFKEPRTKVILFKLSHLRHLFIYCDVVREAGPFSRRPDGDNPSDH